MLQKCQMELRCKGLGLKTVLDAGIGEIACNQLEINGDEEEVYGRSYVSRNRPRAQTIDNSFDTCSNPEQAAELQSIGEVRVNLAGLDTYTAACGGSAGTFQDNVSGFVGAANHPAWSGTATYEREVYNHLRRTIGQQIIQGLIIKERIQSMAGVIPSDCYQMILQTHHGRSQVAVVHGRKLKIGTVRKEQ